MIIQFHGLNVTSSNYLFSPLVNNMNVTCDYYIDQSLFHGISTVLTSDNSTNILILLQPSYCWIHVHYVAPYEWGSEMTWSDYHLWKFAMSLLRLPRYYAKFIWNIYMWEQANNGIFWRIRCKRTLNKYTSPNLHGYFEIPPWWIST